MATVTHYLIDTPFNAFANRADQGQAGSTLFANEKIIYPILH